MSSIECLDLNIYPLIHNPFLKGKMVLKCCCLVENTSPKGGNDVILSYVGPRNELNCKCGESEGIIIKFKQLKYI